MQRKGKEERKMSNIENIKRQKIVERDKFTYEDKLAIAEKSDCMCCHCGKKCYPDFGATIEHFVPLSEGGTNRDVNLIMLCEDCNKEKESKIYEPTQWIKHLKEENLKQLIDYFDSYIRSFEFFERRNVLACDKYIYHFMANAIPEGHKPKKGKKNFTPEQRLSIDVELNRVNVRDLPEVIRYFIKYSKKRGIYESDEKSERVLRFWYRHACLYYVRRNGEISALCMVSICSHEIDLEYDKTGLEKYSLVILPMAYYDNTLAFNISTLLATEIPETVMEEQDIPYLPVEVCTFPNDKFLPKFASVFNVHVSTFRGEKMEFPFSALLFGSKDSLTDENAEKVKNFFARFDHTEEKAMDELGQETSSDIAWIGDFLHNDMMPSNRKLRVEAS